LSRRSRSSPVSESVQAELAESLGQRLARMDRGDFTNVTLTRFEIARFLELNHTNSSSLIAAFEASRDKEYLRYAAEKFPQDPTVLGQVLLNNALPERRQEMIDSLKRSDPQNSLANFLGATERLKAGDFQGALQEMQGAQGKSYNDFFRNAALGLEEAYAAAGRPPAEAKAFGGAEILLPELAPIKNLAQKMVAQAQEMSGQGDAEGARAALDWTWEMGRQLRESGRQGTLLLNLVGLAVQNISLQKMDGNAAPDYLGRSVQEELAANKVYREGIKEDVDFFGSWLPSATDQELISYFDRMKILGEQEAMRWIRERRPELEKR
jgi:hypothetical protein